MKSNRKKTLLLSVIVTILLIFSVVPAFAAEDAVLSIRIDAALWSDGSTAIIEVQNVRGVYSGTEYHKTLNHMGSMSAHSLTVKDESGVQYETLSTWDADRSGGEKAGTHGILEASDGYKLCWGISTYGGCQYTIQCIPDGLIKDHGDYVGFYHQPMSNLPSAPESVSVKIRMANTSLTRNSARIWGYSFPGEVQIVNSGILAADLPESSGDGGYVNLLRRSERGLLLQATKADMSFEDLQKDAENEESPIVLYILGATFAVLVIRGVAAFVLFFSHCKLVDGTAVRLAVRDQIRPAWSVPFGGSIPAVYAAMKLLRKGISCDKLMGAYPIHWQKAGYISIEGRENPQGKKRPEPEEVIAFQPEKMLSAVVEQSLCAILTVGADLDGILWNSTIEKRAERLYEELTRWTKEVESEGEKELIPLSVAAKDKNGAV